LRVGSLGNFPAMSGEPMAKRPRRQMEEVPVTDDTWYLKLAVTDDVASSIIGRGGQAIKAMLSTCGGTARISHPGMYVPGAPGPAGVQLRAMFIAGSLTELPMLLGTVIEKHAEVHARSGSEKQMSVKLVCAKSAVSQVMGPGGQTAKELVAQTGAKFSASDSDTTERILTLFGDPDAISALALQIAQRINVDPNFRTAATQLDYTGSPGMMQSPVMHSAPQIHSMPPPAMRVQAARPPPAMNLGMESGEMTNAFMELPDELMGAMIGKGGATIRTLCQMSGAKITVLPQGSMLPGVNSQHRVLRMTGNFSSVHKAHELVFKTMTEAQATGGLPAGATKNQYIALGAY